MEKYVLTFGSSSTVSIEVDYYKNRVRFDDGVETITVEQLLAGLMLITDISNSIYSSCEGDYSEYDFKASPNMSVYVKQENGRFALRGKEYCVKYTNPDYYCGDRCDDCEFFKCKGDEAFPVQMSVIESVAKDTECINKGGTVMVYTDDDTLLPNCHLIYNIARSMTFYEILQLMNFFKLQKILMDNEKAKELAGEIKIEMLTVYNF